MKSKIQFVVDFLTYALKGDKRYYAWLGFLGLFVIFWFYGNYQQLSQGMIVTGLTDQVSWGIYLANFIFLVGVAAAAVTVVFPAYVYDHKGMHKVAVLGEMLAIAAVVMCILFVLNHMGRPDRLWHIFPGIGIYNWPYSMLTWDVLVLSGYLVLNAVCAFYYLYKKYVDKPINYKFFLPLVFLAIVWAFSIHTVTAFLINTMPARPAWHHSMMPIRFITTAFAAGPCLIVLAFLQVRKHTKFEIDDSVFHLLSTIITVCLGLALFLTLSEVVTELYASSHHSFSLKYLIYGMSGLDKLVPYFWGSLLLMVLAFIGFLIPKVRKNLTILPILCVMTFTGIWVEKGMGLLLPGFTPSPIGEWIEYYPTWIEIGNTVGNWAIGFIIFTLLLKGSVGILLGDISYAKHQKA
jgi:Ni/Fe-hydrogenase subunit HybB-like protein